MRRPSCRAGAAAATDDASRTAGPSAPLRGREEGRSRGPLCSPATSPCRPATKLTASRTPFEGQGVDRGRRPRRPRRTPPTFFGDELEDAGYAAGRRDAEPGEVESLFTGENLRGGWRVNDIPNCEGASKLTLVLIRL